MVLSIQGFIPVSLKKGGGAKEAEISGDEVEDDGLIAGFIDSATGEILSGCVDAQGNLGDLEIIVEQPGTDDIEEGIFRISANVTNKLKDTRTHVRVFLRRAGHHEPRCSLQGVADDANLSVFQRDIKIT
ncbi:MAG: hypothetical protein KKB66_10855 [Alphaproteobacteria bacterium]|jgi:hypothetical protein|nr:hypothetical protein [Alphaproteobacteria bacterium]MBU0804900.1 hypothetical protein [Alphaproteobacteria bacterium]MBU0870399.1 hypothetical protein [Alphaproteobacteria bacterium]MBU1401926.1 hypothetical protein [Alphaproteobacteria bacterium]MBU1591657.1 hypothetical protein [Alphaproteobacteria bacterium]